MLPYAHTAYESTAVLFLHNYIQIKLPVLPFLQGKQNILKFWFNQTVRIALSLVNNIHIVRFRIYKYEKVMSQ